MHQRIPGVRTSMSDPLTALKRAQNALLRVDSQLCLEEFGPALGSILVAARTLGSLGDPQGYTKEVQREIRRLAEYLRDAKDLVTDYLEDGSRFKAALSSSKVSETTS